MHAAHPLLGSLQLSRLGIRGLLGLLRMPQLGHQLLIGLHQPAMCSMRDACSMLQSSEVHVRGVHQ